MSGQQSLQCGFAKIDITPPLAMPYLSFHPRQTPFEGVHDRLFARALVVEAPAHAARPKATVAIVSADALGFSRSVLGPGRDFIAEVRAKISDRTGIPAQKVLIAASHAH